MKQLKLRIATPDFKLLVELSRSITKSVGPTGAADPTTLAEFILPRALHLFDAAPGMLDLFFATHPIFQPGTQADDIAENVGDHAGQNG